MTLESKYITGKKKVHKRVKPGKMLRTTRKQDNSKAKSYREVLGQEQEGRSLVRSQGCQDHLGQGNLCPS